MNLININLYLSKLLLPHNGINSTILLVSKIGVILMTNKNTLPLSTPESQGICCSSIQKFIDAIEENKLELHSFMILRHGHVVSEGWWHPYSSNHPHMLFSLSKSFTSTAIGFAVGEGLLSVEDTVIDFFPEDRPEKVSDFLAAMKVKHLLSMSTGHAEDTTGRVCGGNDENWVKTFLSLEIEYEPGTHFVYNTAATYMLSAIIQKLTGQTLLSYLKPRLFDPLGIENATWEVCPRGINTGGFGLSIKTEDIAKFGQLYLQKGMWNGSQIISNSWIEEATTSHISNGDDPLSDWAQGYCYQFWRCRNNVYRGDGAFGQYCIVMPEQDAVIAITSGLNNMQAVLSIIWEQLLPAMSASSLPENPKAQAELQKKLQNLTLPMQPGQLNKSAAEKICCKRFDIEKNELNLEYVSFNFEDSSCKFILGYTQGEQSVNCGFEEFKEGVVNFTGSPTPVMTCCNWSDENTFTIKMYLVETPFCYTIACRFDDDNIELELNMNVGFNPEDSSPLKGSYSRHLA